MLPIAIGGSAANPVTVGHYHLIEWLLNSKKFSTVVWILSGSREDKKHLIDADHRLTLTLLSFPQEWFLKKDVRFVVSFHDVYGQNTPTIEWLKRFKEMYPHHKLVWYTGADSVIPQEQYDNKSEIEARWHSGDELMKEWNFLVFPRHGYHHEFLSSLPSNFEIADASIPDVSSSLVRTRIAEGQSFEDLVMPQAALYIKQHGLFGYKKSEL